MFFRKEILLAFFLIFIVIFLPKSETKAIENLKSNFSPLYENLFRNWIRKPPLHKLCKFCEAVVPVVRHLIDKNDTAHFTDLVSFACEEFKIEDKTVCQYVIKTYELSVITVIQQTSLTSEEACSLALGCSNVTNPIYDWNITLPNVPKPPVKPLQPPKPGSPTLRILQLSDIHIDFEYQPGALADCNQPLCCRNNSNLNKSISDGKHAGFWGENRNCDIPVWTVENMFDYISKNEQFDFIYWTGDLPPHNVWNQTKNDQLTALSRLTGLFQKYFPNKSVFPTLGNHEATPCNLFPTPSVKADNISWLYEALSKEWTQTGLPSYLSANISKGAFYTIKLFSNLRLISLNTNYCPPLNFWLFINSTDPLGQLEWLSKVLQFSEDHGEKVHIIGHIDPSQCLSSWSKNYYRIINRYESTIMTQMFGHTHNDEIRVFYDLDNPYRATNVAYVTPSVTTFSYLNPGYRIYTVDGNYQNSTWRVLDYETMFMNITEANLFNVTRWQTEYSSIKAAYNLKNLFPQEWSDFLDTVLKDLNGTLAQKLFRYFAKSSDNYPSCDDACKRKLVCSFKQARSGNFIPC